MSYALWAAQVALAALFLFAGGMKLALPLEKMAGPPALPGAFLRFIGLAKVCGALGLILPGLAGFFPGWQRESPPDPRRMRWQRTK